MEPSKYMNVILFSWLLLDVLWCHGCWEQEKFALLQVKQFFNDPHNPLNWDESGDQSTSDCCKWRRVKCSSATGRVLGLSLNQSRGWDLPELYLNASYFLPFEELRILDLRDNHIGGCLEGEGFEKLSLKLSNLEVLDLGANQFDDSIILSLTGISSLKSLYLDNNDMEASPNHMGFERLSRLSRLELLDLSNNKFNNSLISSLGSLSSLKVLNLADNLLSGTIDTRELNNLSNLTELDMRGNKIEGFTSSKGGEPQLILFDLEVLILSFNLFNNNVLSSLIGLSRLKSLNLAENRLTGSVHVKELEALANLEELDMRDNNIEEFVGPEDKRTLNKLQILHLQNLQFDKSIVLQSLGAFSSIKILDIRGNILNRTMTLRELTNLSTVEELFLDHSILHKDFLQSIGTLTSLRILHLDDCSLKGTLPSQGWCELKNLQELDLSGNELEGTLPPCLANLSSLQNLVLSHNNFTGNIASTSIPRLVSIKYLLLGYNHFQVPISFTPFANYSNLKGFQGDNNELTADPASQSWTPNFQLQVLSLSNCVLHQSIAKLPNFLYYQYDLRYVALSNSDFGGVLPSWLLDNNTRLEIFLLRGNSFTGLFQLPSLPNQNLHLLDISHNRVQGQIPPNVSAVFPHVNMLIASENSFQGNIPPSFGEIKSLEFLDLSNNLFSGKIPEQFFDQRSSFYTLKLSKNELHGPIFPTNFSSTRFQFLELDGNNLLGEIPDLSSSKYLYLLDISNNLVSGKLPKSMANLSYLEHIFLANNKFEGPVPSEFCQLYELQNLVLSENNFSGSIPSCLNRLQSLRRVHLNGNKLSGLLPLALMNSSNLIILDLRNNNFYGAIPNWIDTLSSLSVLLLQANHLQGEIPTALCQMNGLTILDLSSNNFSGHLPPCLGNLTLTTRGELSDELDRKYLDHTFSDLEATYGDLQLLFYTIQESVEFTSKRNSLHYTGKILDQMYGIDLSCNKFTGEIPVEFGNLSNVRGLNLSHNSLTGPIPAAFSNLKQLESLDLSHNDLNGLIPSQLTELNSLAVFSVAYNNLSGPVPDRKAQFGTFDERSYEGNPYLCGPPLINSCDESGSASPTLNSFHGDDEEYDGFMDITGFYVSFAAAYAMVLSAIAIMLTISPYWRQAWFYVVEVSSTRCYYFFVDMLY